jgi:hypothetical protein
VHVDKLFIFALSLLIVYADTIKYEVLASTSVLAGRLFLSPQIFFLCGFWISRILYFSSALIIVPL